MPDPTAETLAKLRTIMPGGTVTADALEGLAAVIEGRTPVFGGR